MPSHSNCLKNGNVIQTKKNAADGSITFDAIEYNAVGEHTYTVRESWNRYKHRLRINERSRNR